MLRAPCTSYTAEMAAILLALTSLRTHPAAGAPVEEEPDEEAPPPTLATDSMASKTKIGPPHEHTTVRETIRTDEHYTLTSIHGLLDETPLRLKHVSAHTGDRFNTLADSLARRAAWRPRPHPPPRFPPDTTLHFHLYFCNNLVNMDSRAHTRAVHVAKHLQEWRSKGSQGLLRQQAYSRNQELKRAGISSHTRWADKFYTKLFANILPTQATRFSRASEHYPCESKTCPHCPATEPENQEDGTAEHLFLRCKHPSFTTLRQELDEQLLQVLQPPENPRRPTTDSLPFMGSFPRASHPATLIHPACLYPHTPHLWDAPGVTPLIIDALPESRFYNKKGNIVSLLKAGHPNAPALPVLDTEFWRLTASFPKLARYMTAAPQIFTRCLRQFPATSPKTSSAGPPPIPSCAY
jgi:ribonuclease HI